MSRRILGLDIGYDAVSAVILNSGLRENEVESFVFLPVPRPETPDEDAEMRLQAVIASLREKMNLNSVSCVVAFSAEQVLCRNVRVPFRGQRKILQVLPFELEPMLPVPVEDLIIDFLPLTQREPVDYTDVIALSARKDDIASCLAVLMAGAGLDPRKVVTGGYATAQYLNTLPDMPENAIVADMRGFCCTLFLIVSRRICLIRTIPVPETADVVTALCFSIRQTLNIADTGFVADDFEAKSLILTGHGLSRISEDHIEAIEEQLSMPVWRTDLLKTAPARLKKVPENWNPDQMDGALAMALAEAEGKNGLNFRKGEFASHADWAVHRQTIIKTGIFLVIILCMFFTSLYMEVSATEEKAEKLNARIISVFKEVFPEKPVVEPVHQMRVAIQELQPLSAETSGIRVIDILDTISRTIPDEIKTEFGNLVVEQPKSVSISGDTDSFNNVDIIKTRLEAAEPFRKVTIVSTETEKNTGKVRFKLKVNL